MTISELFDEERLLALNYTPALVRPAMLALWQLDETLGRIVASTTEPMIGQMRLTWWHERLSALDVGDVPAEPLLQTLSRDVLKTSVTGADMAMLIEGWEALLEPLPLKDAELAVFAEQRGGTLFGLSGKLLGRDIDQSAGEGWALVDFARHCTDRATALHATTMAVDRLKIRGNKLPKPLRILTRLALAKARQSANQAGNPLPRFVFLRAVLG